MAYPLVQNLDKLFDVQPQLQFFREKSVFFSFVERLNQPQV